MLKTETTTNGLLMNILLTFQAPTAKKKTKKDQLHSKHQSLL